ncbi:23S rRNA (adenine(2503)-C(2))-methyltransferase RlmN [Candidatus Sumerlaeota bacterium]|nr:23S rRNA (adenine(2503)-C(2))-methyltransferase RlmN [Candidatus Sumerlaeota bacterium]
MMTSATRQPPRLRGMSVTELEQLLVEAGFEKYRAVQLFQWLQRRGARSLAEMKNLPAALQRWLAENTELGGIASVATMKRSADGSYKFLFQLDDGRKIESVLMPDPIRNYWTLCVSSQVGCAVDCKFCVTGLNGFFRQLRVDEIVDQILFSRHQLLTDNPDANFRNLVYMGMGEPLLNTEAVLKSIRILTHAEGVNLSPRRVTVSTSGIVPGMIELAESNTGVCLALSLNAPSQAEREAVMPITKKYPLADVLNVCRKYQFGRHKRVTFEYVLLHGVNDQEEHAHRLRKLVRGIPCKMNLIPFNPNGALPYERPDREAVDRFSKILTDDHLTVSVRWSKALDVDGACGQLAGQFRQRRTTAPAAVAEMPPDLDFFSPTAADSDEE